MGEGRCGNVEEKKGGGEVVAGMRRGREHDRFARRGSYVRRLAYFESVLRFILPSLCVHTSYGAILGPHTRLDTLVYVPIDDMRTYKRRVPLDSSIRCYCIRLRPWV